MADKKMYSSISITLIVEAYWNISIANYMLIFYFFIELPIHRSYPAGFNPVITSAKVYSVTYLDILDINCSISLRKKNVHLQSTHP